MGQPTTINEIMYTDGTVIDSTRATNLVAGSNYWVARNLPGSGKSTLDSTIGNFNCEVRRFLFSGHGAGNYVTNFKYYISDQNAVSSDMTHMYYASNIFTDPSTYNDSDIYSMVGDWTTAPTSVPSVPNIYTFLGYNEYDDPAYTQFLYTAVVVEAGKTTGTASWKYKLLYQYT